MFTPNGFVLEQACFHVVNMFARLYRPSPALKPNIRSIFYKSTKFFTGHTEHALSVLRRGGT